MVRSNLDGPTLAEKRIGAGYRPELLQRFRVVEFDRCAAAGCGDPVDATHGCTLELFVDDDPPPLDWFTRLLGDLFRRYGRAWVTTPFCTGHGIEAMHYGLDYLEDPDLWAPGRESPPVFPHPLKVHEAPPAELIVARR